MSAIMEDLTGKVFGKLTVICYGEPFVRKNGRKSTAFNCRCECGSIVTVRGSSLKSGKAKSCGCTQREFVKNLNRTHGHSKTRLYGIWCRMKQRCGNPNDPSFDYYGGRGISICSSWMESYTNFENWAFNNGYEDNLTIERMDVNGNYCPENCIWVSRKVQANNLRTNRRISYNGSTKTLSEWSDETGISAKVIGNRINRLGWSVESALTTPVGK